jgi:hypothetical protein
MLTQYGPERVMQKMGGRVVAGRRVSSRLIDFQDDLLIRLKPSTNHFADV